MTLIYEQPAGENESLLHALVIAVGHYPFLDGGEQAQPAHVTEGMGQLSSPPHSAKALTDWLIGSFHHPTRRLGSIDLLISSPEPFTYTRPASALPSGAVEVERATLAKIQSAARQWKDRGQRAADDQLLFFFCGHGVRGGFEYALLAEDFAADREDPYANAISYTAFFERMSDTLASEQVYLIDACRVSSAELQMDHTARLAPLVGWTKRPNKRLKPAPYFSSLAGTAAFGIQGSASLFTQALLATLDGAGASNEVDDEWVVRTPLLQRGLSTEVEHIANGRYQGVQVPQTGALADFEFNYLKKAPAVRLLVEAASEECDEPPHPIDGIRVTDQATQPVAWQRPWAGNPSCFWQARRFCSTLPAGTQYLCEVTFGDGSPPWTKRIFLAPPQRLLRISDGNA